MQHSKNNTPNIKLLIPPSQSIEKNQIPSIFVDALFVAYKNFRNLSKKLQIQQYAFSDGDDPLLCQLLVLIYILDSEKKGLIFTKTRSLSETIKQELDITNKQRNGKHETHHKTNNTYLIHNQYVKIIQHLNGSITSKEKTCRIPGLVKAMFDISTWRTITSHKITDKDYINILSPLLRTVDQNNGQYLLFTSLNSRIYGQILEYFLDQHPGSCRTLNKGSQRRDLGAYFTPENIISEIVNETITKPFRKYSVKELKQTSVCDPAVGSGYFLIQALQVLATLYQSACVRAGLQRPTLIESKLEMVKHLFGADISSIAIKATKLSLWSELFESKSALPDLNNQFKVGNSLTEVNWQKSFPKVFKAGGFSAILSNPPYLDYRQIPSNTIAELSRYDSCGGGHRFNLFMPFLELATSLLSNSGRWGMITPSSWLTAQNAKPLRQNLLQNCTFIKIIDLSSETIFQGVATYPAITIVRKGVEDKASKYIRIEQGLNADKKEYQIVNVPLLQIQNTNDLSISANRTRNIGLINKIERRSIKRLHDYAEIFKWGTSRTGYGQLKIETPEYLKLQKDKKQAFRKLVQTRDIQKGTIDWHGQYIPIDIYSDNVKAEFEGPKLIIARLAKEIRAVFDSNKHFLGKVSFIQCNDSDKLHLLELILNSTIATYWFNNSFESLKMSGGYLRYDIPYLKQIPLPDLDSIKMTSSLYKNVFTVGKLSRLQLDKIVAGWYGLSEKELVEMQKSIQGTISTELEAA